MRGLRLPLLCEWGLRSSGIWHSVDWYLFTDVSGQPISPICKGQEVLEEIVLGLLDLCSETTNKRRVTSQRSDDLVGGRLSSPVQLYNRQQAYFVQYF